MTDEVFKEELGKRTSYVNELLEGFLPGADEYEKTLSEAVRYSVTAGGKRIRPVLMQETCALFGESPKALPYFMAAIEFIHTYSLVHDDLPAMDDDEYRRGKKTTHVVYGEAMGILAGDALLNYAFEVASTALENEANEAMAAARDGTENAVYAATEAIRAVKSMGILSRKAGIYGMGGGQAYDVESEGRDISLKEIMFIHEKKTCAMIESAMMIGAVLGGAGDDDIRKAENAARELGLAFQIRDDILDVEGDAAILGKATGSDEKKSKPTYVTIEGMDEAKAAVKGHSEAALSIIKDLGGEGTFLEELVKRLVNRDR